MSERLTVNTESHEDFSREWADYSFNYLAEDDEPMHGPDCLRRSVEEHAVEMGRASWLSDGQRSE